jgi:hypothetical protein
LADARKSGVQKQIRHNASTDGLIARNPTRFPGLEALAIFTEYPRRFSVIVCTAAH